MSSYTRFVIGVLSLLSIGLTSEAQGIPGHPSDLRYELLDFIPPVNIDMNYLMVSSPSSWKITNFHWLAWR